MNVLNKWKRSLYKRALKAGIVAPKVVTLLDGGICSQMHQYLLGQLYAQQGSKVAYDLSWYDEWGMDKDHRFVRNFDLLKAFPYLTLKKASPVVTDIYKQKFYYEGNNTTRRVDDFSFLDRTPPLYLGGYYHLPADVWLFAFQEIFRLCPEILDEANLRVYREIQAAPCSVAVHVRRGDLKVEMYDYGKPASLDYFRKAVAYFQERESAPYFYFFSDEPEWVTDELLPQLRLTADDGRTIDINGSDKGYMDLYLIAACTHQITSKGTLGKYGALLRDCPEKQVVLCDDAIEYPWGDLLHYPIFL